MDLLGRKARRLLTARTARLEAVIQLANQQTTTIAELYARVQSLESLTSDLIAENGALGEQAQALAERAAYLEGALAAKPEPGTYRVSEEEQEAEWQLKQGLIDAQEYEHLLKELDFQNANIELDPDYTPREVTY